MPPAIALLLRRLFGLAATLAAASIVVFLVLDILPGDPAAIILGTGAQEDTLKALRQELGLDRPPLERYRDWIGAFLAGDLGRSQTYSVPVADLMRERAQVSVPLALLAMALSTAIALPAGTLAAHARGRAADLAVSTAAQIGVAIPNFWFGMLLVIVFALTFQWFPAGGFPGWNAGLLPALKSLILPAIALGLPQAAILTRVTRSSVLEALSEDHIRTARAKGATRAQALIRHALPNALIPVLTILGLQLSFLIAGAVIIESVFDLPGLGKLLFQSIAQRDLVTVRGVVMLLVALVILVNFAVDLLYLAVDPRLRTPAHGRG